MDQVIKWVCDGCGEPVLPKTGYIHVSKVDIGVLEINMQAWQEKVMLSAKVEEIRGDDIDEDLPIKLVIFDPKDIFDNPMPEPVRWQCHHRDCDPEPETDDFFLPIRFIDTYVKLLRNVTVITRAPWLHLTNWSEFLYTITNTEGSTE